MNVIIFILFKNNQFCTKYRDKINLRRYYVKDNYFTCKKDD